MIQEIFASIIVAVGGFASGLMSFSYGDILGDIGSTINDSDIVSNIKLFSFIASAFFGLLFLTLLFFFKRFHKTKAKIAEKIAPPLAGPLPGTNMKWAEVLSHIESPREGEWKFAIIEADKLVDDALRTRGFSGETMGERLMAVDPTQLISLEGLWQAHKVRNRLAHDLNYFLRHAEARQAINFYESTLRELGVL